MKFGLYYPNPDAVSTEFHGDEANVVSNGYTLYVGGAPLAAVRIPAGVKRIAPMAFAGCDALKEGFFDGIQTHDLLSLKSQAGL